MSVEAQVYNAFYSTDENDESILWVQVQARLNPFPLTSFVIDDLQSFGLDENYIRDYICRNFGQWRHYSSVSKVVDVIKASLRKELDSYKERANEVKGIGHILIDNGSATKVLGVDGSESEHVVINSNETNIIIKSEDDVDVEQISTALNEWAKSPAGLSMIEYLSIMFGDASEYAVGNHKKGWFSKWS